MKFTNWTCSTLHPVEISRPLAVADCDRTADDTAVGATLLLRALEKTDKSIKRDYFFFTVKVICFLVEFQKTDTTLI